MNCAFQLAHYAVSYDDTKVSSRWVPRMLTPEQKSCHQQFSEENLDMLRANPENFSRIITEDKTWSIIMIQRPNKCPCNGSTRDPLLPKISCSRISRKDHGNNFLGSKVFCFWNSCHTRHPLLDTPMLHEWWLYARISNRNAVESCPLVSCSFMTMHLLLSIARRRLL